MSGTLAETAGLTTVDLYQLSPAAPARVKIATVVATPNGRGGAAFSRRVSGWTGNAQVIAEWDGDAVALGTTAKAAVVVRQAVKLRAGQTTVPVGSAVKLTAGVLPGTPGQLVLFERRIGELWTLIKAVDLSEGRTADLIWKPPLGRLKPARTRRGHDHQRRRPIGARHDHDDGALSTTAEACGAGGRRSRPPALRPHGGAVRPLDGRPTRPYHFSAHS